MIPGGQSIKNGSGESRNHLKDKKFCCQPQYFTMEDGVRDWSGKPAARRKVRGRTWTVKPDAAHAKHFVGGSHWRRHAQRFINHRSFYIVIKSDIFV